MVWIVEIYYEVNPTKTCVLPKKWCHDNNDGGDAHGKVVLKASPKPSISTDKCSKIVISTAVKIKT